MWIENLEEHIRVFVGVLGALVILVRLPGLLYPVRYKEVAAKLSRWKAGWVRLAAVLFALLGIVVLYSVLVVIFSRVPVFLVMAFMAGIMFLAVGTIAFFPQWWSRILENVVVRRRDFVVRTISLLGMLAGLFLLLSAVFGPRWGGG